MPLPLVTERLVLRRFAPGDVAAILRLSADPAVHEVADELGSNEAEAGSYLAAQLVLEEFERDALFDLAIALRAGGEVVGMATVVRGDARAEIGYALHTDFRGRGYATETAAALLDLAFVELCAAEVQAQVAPSNAASRAVLERVGMTEDTTRRIAVREAGDLGYTVSREAWERQRG